MKRIKEYFQANILRFFALMLSLSAIFFIIASKIPPNPDKTFGLLSLDSYKALKITLEQIGSAMISAAVISVFLVLDDTQTILSKIFNNLYYKSEFLSNQTDKYKDEVSKKLVVKSLDHVPKINDSLFEKFNLIRKLTFSNYFIHKKFVEVGIYNDEEESTFCEGRYLVYDYTDNFVISTLELNEIVKFEYGQTIKIDQKDVNIFENDFGKFLIEFIIIIDEVNILEINEKESTKKCDCQFTPVKKHNWHKEIKKDNISLNFEINNSNKTNHSLRFQLRADIVPTKTEFNVSIYYKVRHKMDDLNMHFRTRYPTEGYIFSMRNYLENTKFEFEAIWFKFWQTEKVKSVEDFAENKDANHQGINVYTSEWLIPGEGFVVNLQKI